MNTNTSNRQLYLEAQRSINTWKELFAAGMGDSWKVNNSFPRFFDFVIVPIKKQIFLDTRKILLRGKFYLPMELGGF